MRNIDRKRWKQEYPRMPISFHQALLEEVNRQTGADDSKIRQFRPGVGRTRSRRLAVKAAVLAAAMTLCGITVFAAARFRLPQLFGWRFPSEEEETIIQTDPDVTQPETVHISAGMAEQMDTVDSWPALPDTSPLLDIKEVFFDGLKLYIYALPTENGKNYDLNADRLYINDREVGPVSTAYYVPGDSREDEMVDQEMYTFEVDLSALNLTGTFEVTLPLSVYEKEEDADLAIAEEDLATAPSPIRYQNQDLTFTVDTAQTVIKCPDQTFAYDDLTLEVTEMTVSATTIRASFYYHMSPELLKDCQMSKKTILPPAIFSESGEEAAYIVCSVADREDGMVFTVDYSNPGISEKDATCLVKTKLRDYSTGEEYQTVAESTLNLKE